MVGCGVPLPGFNPTEYTFGDVALWIIIFAVISFFFFDKKDKK